MANPNKLNICVEIHNMKNLFSTMNYFKSKHRNNTYFNEMNTACVSSKHLRQQNTQMILKQ